MIPGKRTPGGIRAMHPRRQSDDQQPGLRIPERDYRSRMIGGKLKFDLIEEISQPLTPAASVNADCHLNSASLSRPWR